MFERDFVLIVDLKKRQIDIELKADRKYLEFVIFLHLFFHQADRRKNAELIFFFEVISFRLIDLLT